MVELLSISTDDARGPPTANCSAYRREPLEPRGRKLRSSPPAIDTYAARIHRRCIPPAADVNGLGRTSMRRRYRWPTAAKRPSLPTHHACTSATHQRGARVGRVAAIDHRYRRHIDVRPSPFVYEAGGMHCRWIRAREGGNIQVTSRASRPRRRRGDGVERWPFIGCTPPISKAPRRTAESIRIRSPWYALPVDPSCIGDGGRR